MDAVEGERRQILSAVPNACFDAGHPHAAISERTQGPSLRDNRCSQGRPVGRHTQIALRRQHPHVGLTGRQNNHGTAEPVGPTLQGPVGTQPTHPILVDHPPSAVPGAANGRRLGDLQVTRNELDFGDGLWLRTGQIDHEPQTEHQPRPGRPDDAGRRVFDCKPTRRRSARSIRSRRVIDVLARLVSLHGAPRYMRSDNGPEFVSHAILRWMEEAGVETALIDTGKPWQNGAYESFNGKFRDECLSV